MFSLNKEYLLLVIILLHLVSGCWQSIIIMKVPPSHRTEECGKCNKEYCVGCVENNLSKRVAICARCVYIIVHPLRFLKRSHYLNTLLSKKLTRFEYASVRESTFYKELSEYYQRYLMYRLDPQVSLSLRRQNIRNLQRVEVLKYRQLSPGLAQENRPLQL